MQKSKTSFKETRRSSMSKNGIWKWGCRCCGPKDRYEKRLNHQSERAHRKIVDRMEIDEGILEKEQTTLYTVYVGDIPLFGFWDGDIEMCPPHEIYDWGKPEGNEFW